MHEPLPAQALSTDGLLKPGTMQAVPRAQYTACRQCRVSDTLHAG